MKTSGIGRMLIACWAAGVLFGMSVTGPALAGQPAPAKAKAEKPKDDGVRDKVIFRSGRLWICFRFGTRSPGWRCGGGPRSWRGRRAGFAHRRWSPATTLWRWG